MKNKIEDLRNQLFETLEALRDDEKPMDIERAKAIAGVAQVIVDTAKAENDFIKLTGSKGSGFIAPQPVDVGAMRAAVEAGDTSLPRLSNGAGKHERLGMLARCSDPNCGGTLSPQTDGSGGLKDVCDKCHRTIRSALTA